MNRDAFHFELLQKEFTSRKTRNPCYSLRAFARSLEVSPSTVSRLMRGASPSPETAQRLSRRVSNEPEAQSRFWDSLVETWSARLAQSGHLIRHISQRAPRPPVGMGAQVMERIAPWYHYAMLELTNVVGFCGRTDWIARRLGISPAEAETAVTTLVEEGLLARDGDKITRPQPNHTTAGKHRSSAALRLHQRQMFEKGLESLDRDPIEIRSHTGMTVAIDTKKIPQAKAMIREFNEVLAAFLGDGERTAVYQFSAALFPLEAQTPDAATSVSGI